MPSSIAAFVAARASSTLCFLAFCSTSVAAPTLIIATPEDNLLVFLAFFLYQILILYLRFEL
jgi:hypothetical protein